VGKEEGKAEWRKGIRSMYFMHLYEHGTMKPVEIFFFCGSGA
jgi:hypothetical protein